MESNTEVIFCRKKERYGFLLHRGAGYEAQRNAAIFVLTFWSAFYWMRQTDGRYTCWPFGVGVGKPRFEFVTRSEPRHADKKAFQPAWDFRTELVCGGLKVRQYDLSDRAPDTLPREELIEARSALVVRGEFQPATTRPVFARMAHESNPLAGWSFQGSTATNLSVVPQAPYAAWTWRRGAVEEQTRLTWWSPLTPRAQYGVVVPAVLGEYCCEMLRVLSEAKDR